MAAVPVPRVISAESTDRDRSRKLLRLLEYATNAGAEGLSDTLSVLLLSLMGEFTATGGAVLVRDEAAGGLRVMASRGSVQARSAALALPAEGDHATLTALGLELVVPMVHREQTLGYLGLANRIVGTYRAEDRELVRMVAGIAATTIQNHELHAELRSVNRVLERRVFDLHTVFNVSAELNGGHEPESIFRAVGQTVMAHLLVSRCVVIMEEDGHPKLSFSRGVRFSEAEQNCLEALDFSPPLAVANSGGGRPQPPFAAALAAAGIDELIPLHGGETVRGFLGVGGHQNRRPLEREDTAFLQTLGQQAITALDNLRLHVDRARRMQLERELAIARQIQRALLPSTLPEVAGYQLAVLSEPCYEVGGDYYDLLPLTEGVLVAIGDVSGKSVPAALLMSVVQATIRSLAGRPGESPATLVHALNHHLIKSTQPTKFVSLFLAWLDPESGHMEYSNAGHNPPLVARVDGTQERLVSGGPVLGILEDATFTQSAITLEPGDLLFLYTDGVTEAMDCVDNEFGDERLESVLKQARTSSAAAVLQQVTAAVAEHTNGVESSDDVTAVAIKRVEA